MSVSDPSKRVASAASSGNDENIRAESSLDASDDETTTNIIFNRFIFHQRSQKPNETVEKFVRSLRKLISCCDYKSDDHDGLVRDRLICGVRGKSTQAALLAAAAESRGNLDLATAVELAHKRQQNAASSNPKDETHHVVATSNQQQSLGINEINNPAPKPVEWSEVGTAPSFSRRSLATLKNRNATSRRKRLECEACDFKCLTKQLLAAHTMDCHGIETYCHKHSSCTECLQIFLSPATLRAHMLLEHKKRLIGKIHSNSVAGVNFSCEVCGLRCSSMTDLKTHLNLFHPDTKNDAVLNKKSKHRCEHCNFKALNAKHLDQHVRLAHTDVKRVVINCEFCDFSTINKNQYIKHLTKDHKGAKGFMCETCGKKFATDKSMEIHQKVVHEKKKPYKCELCEYTAGQKSSLVHHMNWVHERKKPYACENCDYSSVSKSTLTNHQRMVHEKRRPHECKVCSRTFASRHGLKNHVQLIHEHQQPHCCEVCGRRFKRKPELDNHVRCVHEGKYHVCNLCGHNFYSSRNLERHVTVVHKGEKPYPCTECGQKFARKERLRHHAERCGVTAASPAAAALPPAAKVKEEEGVLHHHQVMVDETQTIYIPVDEAQVEATPPGGQHITVTAEDGTVVSTHQIIALDGHPQHHQAVAVEPHHSHHQVVQIHPSQGGPHHVLLQQQPDNHHHQSQHQQQQIQIQQLQPMEVQAVHGRGAPTVQTLHFRQH